MAARIGKIGMTTAESSPAYDPPPRPPAGAPNVLLVVLDDLGFGQLGCFGSDIATPQIDRLAEGGLRYNRFHVTALCSPTRACLLTGRNHHAVGMGFLPDIPIGFPGYHTRIPRSAATLPRVLRDRGYSAFAVGKWHLAPRWEQSASGPFDRWPLGLGFERYYGFLNGDTNQWAPELVSDNGFTEPPRRPEEGYHLTEDLADRAIRFIQDQQQATPGKPFFCYFATGAVHAPHHAPRDHIDRYRGAFDDGWEAWRQRVFERQLASGVVPERTTLPARPPWVPAWSECSPDERRLFSRMMEVFAGYLSHTDEQLGRVVSYLERTGLLDNTLVLCLSDNGTSAEGGPIGSLNEHRFTHDMSDVFEETLERIEDLGGFRSYNHYPWGWAWAGNTPLRLWKRYTWLGGVRTPLVVHWPGHVGSPGAVRSQFCHAVDLMPTILEAAGIEAPEVVDGVDQQPFAGASLLASLSDEAAPSPRDTQYFEMLGSRAIYHAGWKATTDHVGRQLTVEMEQLEGSLDFATDRWSLFDLENDFAEAHDRAAEEPERLARMVEVWWHEAGRNQVLPLDDSFVGRAFAMEPSPNGIRARARLLPGGGGVIEDALPPGGAGFRVVADIEVGANGAPCGGGGSGRDGEAGETGAVEGVLAALGDWNNGWALFVKQGRPVVVFSLFGAETRVEAAAALTEGRHTVGFEFTRRPPGGALTLTVDGHTVGEGTVARDLPFRWQIGGAGLLVGRDSGFPVCADYTPPFPFCGTLLEVTVEAPALVALDGGAEVARALHHE